MAKFELVPNLIYADRREWVTSNLPRQGGMVPREARTHVFIHHTVTPDSDATPNIWESEAEIFDRMRKLQTIRPDLGLDVPYSFVAFLFGPDKLMICEGRGEDRSGAHTKGHNTAAIAVSFAGDFHNNPPDGQNLEARLDLLSRFLGWLKTSASHPDYGDFEPMRNLGSLKPQGRNVWLHSDIKATACPGQHIEALADRIDFIAP